MERTYETEQTASTTQSDEKFYLPGMPRLSSRPGYVERFLTTLFRRRGENKVVVRRIKQ